MDLLELQNVLGSYISNIDNENLSESERKNITERADVIARLAKQMINNADVVLRTEKLIADGKVSQDSTIAQMINKKLSKDEEV